MTATPINRKIDPDLVKKLFSKFAVSYGASWTSRCASQEEWELCATTYFEALAEFDYGILRMAVRQALHENKIFPPTLSQLIDYCFNQMGVPDEDLVFCNMVRKEFDHPLIKICYDKIGSFYVSRASEKDLRAKLKSAYREATNIFRENPKKSWELWALPPEKIHIPEKLLNTPALTNTKKEHPAWPPEAINYNHRRHDRKVFFERRTYLINLTENEACSLGKTEWYDRVRFIRELDGVQRAEIIKPYLDEGKNKTSPMPLKTHLKLYKNWIND